MQLLYVDQDQAAARVLHGEFLSYRGAPWDLVHFRDRDAASAALDNGDFQVVLYHSPADLDSVRCDLDPLVRAAGPPVVTLLDNVAPHGHLQLIHGGVHDSLIRAQVNGVSIMRQLRMADVRRAAWRKASETLSVENIASLAPAATPTERMSTHDAPSPSVTPLAVNPNVVHLSRLLPTTVRIAHVHPERNYFDMEGPWLRLEGRFHYEQFADLRGLIDRWEREPQAFDAILVDNSVFENQQQSALSDFDAIVVARPCTVLTIEKSDYAALSYLKQGFADCLVLDAVSLDQIEHAIYKSIVRHRRTLQEAISQIQVGPNVSERRKTARAGANRRKHVRFLMQRPVLAIPMLPNGSPDCDQKCHATSIDISLGGMALAIPKREQLPSRHWILGIEQRPGEYGYVNAYLRRINYVRDGLQIGVIFHTDEQDFLDPRNLIPDINPTSKRFDYRTPESVLLKWSDLGVLRRDLLQRAKVCPECQAALVVGRGCAECGSFHIRFLDLIHHFACAYVDESGKFQQGDAFSCPKCLCGSLVIGADFEVIRSRYACDTCGHTGAESADVSKCLACDLRFPLTLAQEIEVYRYDVERLDILALVDSAR